MKLIVFTDPGKIRKESKILNELFYSGLQILHLRKPGYKKQRMIELLDNIDPSYYNRIMIHNEFSLAGLYPLKGVHLNAANPVAPPLENTEVSRSFHSFEELSNTKETYCYKFISPIFDSISKTGYKKAFQHEELMNNFLKNIINENVIALGGISIFNIPVAKYYGFGGVGVLGSIWEEYKNNRNTAVFLSRFEELQTLCEKLK